MKNFEDFGIQFAGLKDGKHHFEYHIDNAFFALFEYEEFNSADVDVEVLLEKKPNLLEFHFSVRGNVNVYCDVSNEPFDQPIDGNMNLVVKFGDDFREEENNLIIIPQSAHQVEIQQYVYEAIVLSVPLKKVHPGVMDGTLESEILDKLEELSPGNPKENKNETDPRWDKLKDLLNEK